MRQLKLSLLLGLLLWVPSAYAQSVRFQSQAISTRGAGVANATVAICTQPANTNTQPCSPLATLATSTITTSGGANPLTADSFGNFFFYAAPGRYTVQIYGPAVSGQFVTPDVELSSVAGGSAGTFSNLTVSGALVQSLYSRDCRTDGTIDTTGATDSSATINTCIANAVTNQQSNISLPCGRLLLNNALNLTNRPGLRLKGCSNQLQISSQTPIASVGVTILLCNSGTVCIDTTGSGDLQVKDLELYLAGTGISTPTPIGVLQGRDNNGGGGSGNPFCFAERQVYDNIAVIDFTGGGLNVTANGSRGYIGFYNVAAEQDRYSDVWIYSATNMVFADTNVLSISSPYQTLSTGCPATMNTGTFSNVFLDSQSTITQNHIEATNAINFHWSGLVMLGGGGGIKFGGASQSTTGWEVFADYEQVNTTTSFYIITSVNLLDCIFRSAAQTQLTAVVNPTVNNLSFFNDQFLFQQTTTPFITNTATGTVISGGTISTAATNSFTNTKLLGVSVQAPQVAHTTQTWGVGSNYTIHASDGDFQIGQWVSTGPLVANAGGTAFGLTNADLGGARSATTGALWLGSDASSFIDRGLTHTGAFSSNVPFAFTGGIFNDKGLQIFNTTTTCTTGAAVGATCTTAAISLPVAEADTSYRVVATCKTPTAVPVVSTTANSSATQFTITIAALTAVAASCGSFDVIVGHN